MTGRSSTRPTATRPTAEHRAALGRAAGLGGALLPLFAPLDVFLQVELYPDANLTIVFALRALACVSAFLAWWIARTPRFSDRVAALAHAGCLGFVAAMITGMAYQFGGPSSLYVHGLSVIIMVRAGTVPSPVRESAMHGLLIAAIYPIGFVLMYALSPDPHAQWFERRELATFAAHYLLVVASIGAGCLASRASWIAQRQLFEARKLGRYRLQAQIGKGGQGEVWLARDSALRRNVALKLVRSHAVSENALRMFEREALLASKLQSPHSVRIYDFGASDDGIYYLAMEHLDGADLSALVRGHGPMPAARVVRFGIQVCRSLEEAHALGLVHRDVKPSNLFAARVGDDYDHIKLLDFGVARSLTDDATDLTGTGAIRGTLAYMAPECCQGELATPASDIYSLGATLYHLLVGAPPFTGDEAELVAKHLQAEPESMRLRGAAVDPELEAIVMRCLAKSPAKRYASAIELREALERCAEKLPWTADDAARFWREDRRSVLARWEADTLA